MPAERRARDAVAADHLLLLEHPDAIPELDVHADRADDQVRAAGGPRRLAAAALDPDQLIHHGGVGDVGVRGPVAEREQVAPVVLDGRSPLRRLEAVDRPAHHEPPIDRAHQLAERVHDRVALTRADLQEDVAAGPRRVELVVGERGHRGQLARARRSQPVSPVEQRPAERDRDRQRVGAVDRPEDARVGRRVVDLLDTDGVALREEPRLHRERLERLEQDLPVRRDAVERHECGLVLPGREDPRLVGPIEREPERERLRIYLLRLGGGASRRGRARRRLRREPGADGRSDAPGADRSEAPRDEAASIDRAHFALGILGITGSAVVSSVPGTSESAPSVAAIVPSSCSCWVVVNCPSDG